MPDVSNAAWTPRRHSDGQVSLLTVGASFAAIVAMCLGITVIPNWITSSGNPHDTVAGFFAAVRGGDVEGALEYVEPGEIPTGQQAQFLDPNALRDDWRVEIPDQRDAWNWEPERNDLEIPVTIGSPNGVAKTTVSLSDNDDGWQLQDVLVDVTFPASPLTYHQANGYIPVPQAHGHGQPNLSHGQTYRLFPGVYRFFDDVDGIVSINDRDPVAVLPEDGQNELATSEIAAGPMQAGQRAIEAAQERFNALVDECVSATTMMPPGCPFGSGEFIDTNDGQRVEELSDLSWEVEKYPTISLEDDRTVDPEPDTANFDMYEPGFAVVTAKPGAVTLSGTGTNTQDDSVDFSITCGIGPGSARALVDEDGEVALDHSAVLPEEDDTADTCIEESDG